jgi:hypothetical protein
MLMNECECEWKKLGSGGIQEERIKQVYDKKMPLIFGTILKLAFQ